MHIDANTHWLFPYRHTAGVQLAPDAHAHNTHTHTHTHTYTHAYTHTHVAPYRRTAGVQLATSAGWPKPCQTLSTGHWASASRAVRQLHQG